MLCIIGNNYIYRELSSVEGKCKHLSSNHYNPKKTFYPGYYKQYFKTEYSAVLCNSTFMRNVNNNLSDGIFNAFINYINCTNKCTERVYTFLLLLLFFNRISQTYLKNTST